jgi:hypothetical protein
MATNPSTFLVFGATGGTGKHFVNYVLKDGHKVRALVRTPSKLPSEHAGSIEVVQGSITDPNLDTNSLVKGVDYIVCMIGDRQLQATKKINLEFMKKLVPSMRENGVKRLLYQAGGFNRPHDRPQPWINWILRRTIARSFDGQHKDNEAVQDYLATEGKDIEWMSHLAGIGGDGPSKGTLQRSRTKISVGTHRDCAEYSYRTIMDPAAIHTSDFSYYA